MTRVDGRYTHGHDRSVLRSHEWRTVENSASYLIPHLTSGATVLDVGCGPGSITIDMAERVRPAPVIGIDQEGSVLVKARVQSEGLENVSFCEGDLYRLSFDDESFDVVHAHQVLQHVSQPVQALGEMLRVCRPGGIVAIRDADYGSMAWAPLESGLQRWMEIYQQVARSNGGEPDAGRFLRGWAVDAGVAESDVVSSASIWCFSSPEERSWWGDLWADRVAKSSFAQHALETGAATRDQLDEISASFQAWKVSPKGWFSVPHGEVICHK